MGFSFAFNKKKELEYSKIYYFTFLYTHISQREITFNTTGVISVIL